MIWLPQKSLTTEVNPAVQYIIYIDWFQFKIWGLRETAHTQALSWRANIKYL